VRGSERTGQDGKTRKLPKPKPKPAQPAAETRGEQVVRETPAEELALGDAPLTDEDATEVLSGLEQTPAPSAEARTLSLFDRKPSNDSQQAERIDYAQASRTAQEVERMHPAVRARFFELVEHLRLDAEAFRMTGGMK